MSSDTKAKVPARRRGKPIEVCVTDEEKATISAWTREAGMARSAYLRTLGLNAPLMSIVDLIAVAELAKVKKRPRKCISYFMTASRRALALQE